MRHFTLFRVAAPCGIMLFPFQCNRCSDWYNCQVLLGTITINSGCDMTANLTSKGLVPKILTVDDDSMINEFYGAVLSSEYEVFSATSGAEAINACQMVPPDLILLDVDMPGMNGYETCRKLRELTTVPIVFATLHTGIEEHLKAFDAGGDDIMTKPLSPEILLRKVALAIKLKHVQEKLKEEKESLQKQAKEFLSSIDDSRVLLHFIRASFTCRSYEELADHLVKALQEYEVRGSIAIRHDGTCAYKTTHGEATALEISILEKSQSMGKVFQFQKNFVVNQDQVSILVPDMPVDEKRSGRVQDNIVLLAEAAADLCENVHMRVMSMQRAESMQVAMFEATKVAESIRNKQVQMLMDVRVLLHDLTGKVEQSYSILDTTQDQERTISGAMNDSVQLILDELAIGNQINEQLMALVNSLRGGEKQGDVDLF